MKKSWLIYIGIFIFFSCLSCNFLATLFDKNCTTTSSYRFFLPVQYFPVRSVYNIGDTIRVYFDFSDEIIDSAENKSYKFVNYRHFLPTIRFIRFEDSLAQYDFFNYADTLDMQTNGMSISFFGDKDGGITYDYNYEANRYKASMSFILKKKGIYYFKHTSASYREFPGTFEGQCLSRPVDIYFTHPYNINFDLVKWLIFPNADPRFLNKDAEDQLRREGGYGFEVK